MIGIPLGLAWANVSEWLTHKYLLHGAGLRKDAVFAYHFHDHHRTVRTHAGADPGYQEPLRGWNPQTKEVVGLAAAAALYVPLLPVAPFFTATMWWSIWNYYQVHKRAHLDPAWAREHLPWHYDHHMGPDQHKNWCVTRPWFDLVMGTREVYAGSAKEADDRARRARRTAAAATA